NEPEEEGIADQPCKSDDDVNDKALLARERRRVQRGLARKRLDAVKANLSRD
ncbi:hypothetical protein L917_10752, partial [Phytophthora nicotianae]